MWPCCNSNSAIPSSTSDTATQRWGPHHPQAHSCCYGHHLHTGYASRRCRCITSATAARAVGMTTTSIQKLKGRPQTARITAMAREQRARRAARAGALPDIPNRIQRCSRCREEGHNVLNCRALPAPTQLYQPRGHHWQPLFSFPPLAISFTFI